MLKHNNPSYDDLDKLTEDEKDTLHDLCCYCKALHNYSIPSPSKTKHEKMINEYRTIVGEIASGNNNDELIKRLKQLLIVIRNKNLLPKEELNDALLILIELGY